MEKTAQRVLIAPLALSIASALAGCGGADAEPESTSSDTTSTTTTQRSPSSPSADADTTALGLAAISTAESAAGGQAYQIDDLDDDKIWEVDVRVGSASFEVTVSGDGTQVYSQEGGSLDGGLHAALDGATITLSDAIKIAVDNSGGVLREVELEDATDATSYHWEVSLNTGQPNDTDVIVSMTGEVIEVHD